jgi:ATP-dependent helicase/nuclease subunit B
MDLPLLLTGPNHGTLEKRAFERVDGLAGTDPGSILYLTRYDARRSTVADNWAENYQPLRLRVENLGGVVRDCFERLVGPHDTPTGALRRRLAEYALDGLATDPSYQFGTPPVSTRLAGAFETRFSLFGDVGLTSSEELETTLADTALSERIVDLVADAYESYNVLHDEQTPDWTHVRSAAFEAATTADQPLSELLPNVDAVVLSGYHEFRPVERAMLERLVESFPTLALLPLHAGGDDGVDTAITEALSVYGEAGFTRKMIDPHEGTPELQQTAAALYRSPPVDAPATDSVSWRELPTPEREVRFVAREMKQALADGRSPDDLAVVFPRIEGYQEYVADTFDAFDVPYAMATPRPLDQTMVGQAVKDVLTLADEEPRAETLTTLLSNPLVTAFSPEASTAVTAASRRRDTTALDVILPDLDVELRRSVETLGEEIAHLNDCEIVEATAELDDVLDSLGVHEAVATYASGEERTIEQSARSKVDEVLASFETMADAPTTVSSVALLQRAFEDVPVRSSTGNTAGCVDVLGFLDAGMQSFDHIYLVGLTAEDFPAVVQRPAFFERMTDAVPKLDPGDERERTRYLFATLLANANAVTLTTPSVGDDDSAVVQSPILTELERVTDIDAETGVDDRIASREDLQRAIAARDDRRAALDAAGNRNDFTADGTMRADRGIVCANNRRQEGLTPHGGVLDPSTVEEVYPESEREPYSVSRIERYVNCGYRFYMEHVLDIEAPEEVERTPTPLETGSYVHDVLEQFYIGLQDTVSGGVTLDAHARDHLESHLLDVGLDTLSNTDFEYRGLFYERWLENLFAGLDTPGENPHYGGERGHAGVEDGLFVRFLEHEFAGDRESLPRWLERPFGEDLPESAPGDRFDIELPDGQSMPLRGYIDRMDAMVSDDGLDIHLYDYKTGYAPYMTTVTGGTTFQLPIYLLAATEAVDEEVSALNASYYQVKPPNRLKTPGGIASKFDSQAELRRFLDEAVPERLATIKRAIENGQFHTTLLSAGDAGCQYCDYRRICEVRSHRKRERIDTLQDDHQAYVPQRVLDDSFAETFGGD